MATPTTSPGQATPGPVPALADEPQPRRLLVFAVISIALFLTSVDQTVTATALADIQAQLRASINWTSWTITIYALGQVLMMPLAGTISDLYGRKKVFLIAAVLFTVASLFCGLATNIYTLVVWRAVQSIGGGAFMPAATGIVADQFGRDRDRAIGMFTSIFPIGGIVGPIIGGVFVTYWSWRGIFLINLPLGAILTAFAAKLIPPSARTPSSGIDVRGVVTIGCTLLAGMFGVTYLGSAGSSPANPEFWAVESGAVLALAAFIAHTRRHEAPFIPPNLLVGRGFGVTNIINFLYGAAVLGFGSLVPLYTELRYGLSQLAAGTVLTARAIGMIIVAAVATMMLRRTGYRLPMALGMLLVSAGLALTAIPPWHTSTYTWLAISAAVSGLGMGIAVPATNNASMQLAPEQVGAISGLRGMFRQSGGIMAVAISTAIVARDSAPGLALGRILGIFALVVLLVVPLAFAVPERRGRW